MDVNTLYYQHNYTQIVRDALNNYTGPCSVTVKQQGDQAVLVVSLPPTMQGYVSLDSTTVRVGDEDVPICVNYTFVPICLL